MPNLNLLIFGACDELLSVFEPYYLRDCRLSMRLHHVDRVAVAGRPDRDNAVLACREDLAT